MKIDINSIMKRLIGTEQDISLWHLLVRIVKKIWEYIIII